MDNNRCSASVHNGFGVSFHQCFNKARVTRDGKGFCVIHDPVYVEARRKKLQAKWAEQDKAYCAKEDAKQRRQEAGEMAIALCKRLVDDDSDFFYSRRVPVLCRDAKDVIDHLGEQ